MKPHIENRIEALEKENKRIVDCLDELRGIIKETSAVVPYPVSEPKEECICKCHEERKEYCCSTCWGWHETQAHTPIKEEPDKVREEIYEMK